MMIVPIFRRAREAAEAGTAPALQFTTAVIEQMKPWRVGACLSAFYAGDWGRVSPQQAQANEEAAQGGGRMLAVYPIVRGARALGRDEQLWITRSSDALVFQVMLGSEYLA